MLANSEQIENGWRSRRWTVGVTVREQVELHADRRSSSGREPLPEYLARVARCPTVDLAVLVPALGICAEMQS